MGSSQTRAQTCVPCVGRWILNHCATREVPLYPLDRNNTIFFLRALWGLNIYIQYLEQSRYPVDTQWIIVFYFRFGLGKSNQKENMGFKVKINCVQVPTLYDPWQITRSRWVSPLAFFFFLAALCGLEDLRSLTRDWTWVTAPKARNPNTRPPGNSLPPAFKNSVNHNITPARNYLLSLNKSWS